MRNARTPMVVINVNVHPVIREMLINSAPILMNVHNQVLAE